ncbi:MAG: hypothetical protein FK731_05490 [Asgard group archaeon]|nr:hypothetical protein [Asgard group archaeon]
MNKLTLNKKQIYPKKTYISTLVVSFIFYILIMSTPFRLDVYYWTCSRLFYFFPTSIFPLLFIVLTLILISSFLMNRKKNTTYEIILIVSSLFGLPGVVLGDLGQVIFLSCGEFKTIILPTTYIALGYFLFMSIWGSVLLTRKRELIKIK